MSRPTSDNHFYLLTLGCSKNVVDSESMAQVLRREGFSDASEPGHADVMIVNTCGFINAAKEESLSALRELAAGKREDQLLVAAGCLSQRYGRALVQEVPGLDGVIGTRRWMDISSFVQRLRLRRRPEPLYHLPSEATTVGLDERGVLRAAVQGASAYLKISDGCRRPCAFCAIPKIKGTLVSRPMETILAEARQLQEAGVKEVIIISQDSTDYGHDLGLKDGLSHLLNELVVAAPDVPWIRIMYAYPGYVTERLMETMASHRQIVPYLDLPLQHAHRETLKRMRRPANMEWIHESVARLRALMPDIAIRTTFIVGYPGETDAEFAALTQFVEELRFDRVGIFTYSYEEATPSATISWHVPDDVKEARKDELLAKQQQISLEKNQSLLGKTLPILVEGYGDGLSIGRSYRDAPEVDGLVLVPGRLPVGEFVQVVIDGAMVYDLTGQVAPPSDSPGLGRLVREVPVRVPSN